MGQLTALEYLNFISCTSLTHLPESMGQLTALHTLYLSNCRSLTHLPESIGQLTALEYLSLSRCPSLRGLPRGIGGCTALQNLYLEDNKELRLPVEILELRECTIHRTGTLVSPETVLCLNAAKKIREGGPHFVPPLLSVKNGKEHSPPSLTELSLFVTKAIGKKVPDTLAYCETKDYGQTSEDLERMYSGVIEREDNVRKDRKEDLAALPFSDLL
jgi:Leucine-rich repeat (LRR) protein